jgi:hypothetical protein
VWAVDARQRAAWNHTAAMMALVANCNRDPKRRPRPFEPRDFHPMVDVRRRSPRGQVLTPQNFISVLGRLCRRPPKRKGV